MNCDVLLAAKTDTFYNSMVTFKIRKAFSLSSSRVFQMEAKFIPLLPSILVTNAQ